MLYPYLPITAEDSAIFERFAPSVRKAAHLADQRDMLIGLDLARAADDGRGLTVRQYVLAELARDQAYVISVTEHAAEDFEHVVLVGECPHGVDLDMLADHPNACAECQADAIEADEYRSQVMTEEATAAGSW